MDPRIAELQLNSCEIKVLRKLHSCRKVNDEYIAKHFDGKMKRAFLLLTRPVFTDGDSEVLFINTSSQFYRLTGYGEDVLTLYGDYDRNFWIPIIISNAIAVTALIISIFSILK